MALDDPGGALAAQRTAVDAARTLGPGPLSWARRGQALVLQRLGRFDESVVAFAEAADLAARSGDDVNSARFLVERAKVEVRLRDWRQASYSASSASTIIARLSEQDGSNALLADVRVDALEVQANAAENTNDPGTTGLWLATADAASEAGRCAAGYRSSGARTAQKTEGNEQARILFTTALAEAALASDPVERAWFRAIVLQRRAATFIGEDLNGAIRDARESAEMFIGIDHRLEAARSLWIEGDARSNSGDNGGAVESLREALRLANEVKATDLVRTPRHPPERSSGDLIPGSSDSHVL